MSSTERKMAAIVAMDVTSYSEKMGRDEEGTLKHLRACREIIETVVAENRGRIFNTAGDAFMIEFSSAVSALSAAVEIQKLIKNRNDSLEEIERMYFRMGVNVGDIIIEGDNLYGEGVNIAARLEGIAAPGGISISEKVYAEVRKKFNFVFDDKGHQELKNIDDPVRVYELNTEAVSTSSAVTAGDRKKTAAKNSRNMIVVGVSALLVAIAGYFFVAQKGLLKSSDPAKLANTILFLPVETLSKDDLAKNLAFGLTQDLHSSLSRATGLNIIKVPKKPDDMIALTKQSEAQYVIDSSLMQSGDNFRLTVNLMNTTTMASIWSKTYDKKMSASDIFTTQDEIVKNLVQELSAGGFINAAMMKDIGNRSIAKGTDNISAYECVNFYKAVYLPTFSQENGNKALKCLKESTKTDPNYADAWSNLGNLQASDENIIQAAKIANAHGFISDMDETYDSIVGERGNKLSGGQKQRLSIARAVYKNPKILILDEATSALDTESEMLVQEALEKLMENRTSFVIAHRLSTVRNADEIIVLAKGKIIEKGNHEDLMKKRGAYQKFCTLQGLK